MRFSREPPIVIRDETDEPPNTSPSSSLPSRVTADSNDQQRPLPPRSTSAATRTTVTRSGRHVKHPARYADYVP